MKGFLLVLFSLICFHTNAQSIQEASKAIENKQFEKAIEIYDALINKQPKEADLLLKRALAKKFLADSVGFDDTEICHDLLQSFLLGNKSAYELLENICLDVCWDINTANDAPLNTFCLELDNQKLSYLPANMKTFPNLLSLKLGHNKLKVIDESFTQNNYLIQLDLKHNQLTQVSAYISHFKLLETLDLSNNNISFIAPEINILSQLKVLNLHGNALKSLPKEIFDLENLEILDLSFNPITQLPIEIEKLKKLKKLNLTATPLAHKKDLKNLLPNCEIIWGL